MKVPTYITQFPQAKTKWLGIVLLIVFCIVFAWPALTSPFWGNNDTWSNLLPIIHYRDSILDHNTLPIYTNLWYGGRYQWQNPLWSFLYFPATIIWLATPLDWGARIIYTGHFLFALLAGRKLGSLFLNGEMEKAAAAIILASPIVLAFTAGHIEKIMSWGWFLLGLYFMMNTTRNAAYRGGCSGLCLGVIPLTGANYYALYAGIVLLLIALGYKDKRLLAFLLLGSLLGLIHLPSVWHLIGQARANSAESLLDFRMSLFGIIATLGTGFGGTFGWETYALVGLPLEYLFFKILLQKGKTIIRKVSAFSNIEKALLISLLCLTLLATGVAYWGHHILDTFRVPARAVAFIAASMTVYVLVSIKQTSLEDRQRYDFARALLFVSAIQVCIISLLVRPQGSQRGPYDREAQNLANILVADNTASVWMSMNSLTEMYIHVVLNQNGISLPNVYYGDMGQEVPREGNHCGYSFDHLVTPLPEKQDALPLKSDMDWAAVAGQISLTELTFIQQVQINNQNYNIYRVNCPNAFRIIPKELMKNNIERPR